MDCRRNWNAADSWVGQRKEANCKIFPTRTYKYNCTHKIIRSLISVASASLKILPFPIVAVRSGRRRAAQYLWYWTSVGTCAREQNHERHYFHYWEHLVLYAQ